ncbi:MAG: circularly permuted type 2 ATP-grasp protein [Chloroflexota bacterium]|nr:circularly permuted type 2 ATP-grasp protein [Chloroflexota bacterium]
MKFDSYLTEDHYDELFESDAHPRKAAIPIIDRINSLPEEELKHRQQAAEAALMQMGITFTVYGTDEGTDRIFPFDVLPRIIEPSDWEHLERGLSQRICTLNLFLEDIYNEQRIIKEKVIPAELITSGRSFRPEITGLHPPKGRWCHISGIDIVRHRDGEFYVLEDNLRCPSGISYVLENRRVLKHTFPRLFETLRIRPVDDYPNRLLDMLEYLAPDTVETPSVAVLTPGIYNSAYFEHSFLAQQMGVPLVEGRDLVVSEGFVYMRTTRGFERVDVIYRRIDDDFLDPEVFRPDSTLGIPGIMEAYKAGKIAIANTPGTGIADDKAIYTYVPKMIEFYLEEDVLLPNVQTYVCWDGKERQYVLQNLDKLVVKSVNESGGYGMLVGPHATKKEREDFRHRIESNPRNFIAQPTLDLSRVPTIIDDHIEGRHVDLRPYALYGEEVYVHPGGLTRVALRKGSLVVNSSQGGGSKDTWVLEEVTV